MLFATNRRPKGLAEPAPTDPFVFDLDDNSPAKSFFCCERRPDGTCSEIGSRELLGRLKAAPYRQVLLFVHGYSTLPEQAFASARELQALCDWSGPGEALVVPVVWPCDNDLGKIKDYWDDEQAADMSAFAFARLLEAFAAWRDEAARDPSRDPCLKRINVLAHSMGNRVLRQTLVAWTKYHHPAGPPLLFRNAFLVAADILNESLARGEPGELVARASKNVVVYHAADDLALRASKVANLRAGEASRRLGHTGPEDMSKVPGNVYAVDCDAVNHECDRPLGHSYFRGGPDPSTPGPVFAHLFEAMRTGRAFPGDDERRKVVLPPIRRS